MTAGVRRAIVATAADRAAPQAALSRSNEMNVCMVGCSMMGGWHSKVLQRSDTVLHTVVGPSLLTALPTLAQARTAASLARAALLGWQKRAETTVTQSMLEMSR